jgi:hypothetical protein
MSTMLIYAGVLVELGLLAWTVAMMLKEKRALETFVRAANEPERLKEAAMSLPALYRAPATQFAGDLARKAPLDEVMTKAVTEAANTQFGIGPIARVLSGIGLALLLFSPAIATLFEAARRVREARDRAGAFGGTRAFLEAKEIVDPAFDSLHGAFQGTALLFAGLAIVTAAHWWVNRPEVREARFVRALLQAAIAAKPGASAPVSGRLSQLLAPDRSRARPIGAFVFFLIAIVLAWTLLDATAPVKEANAQDVYAVWPGGRERIQPPAGMKLPHFKGGGWPLRGDRLQLPTLQIGPSTVEISGTGTPLADLDMLELPENWKTHLKSIDKGLAAFRRGGTTFDLAVLGHAPIHTSVVLEILRELRNTSGLSRVHLVFERELAGAPQAAIAVSLKRPEMVAPALKVAVELNNVVVGVDAPEPVSVDRSRPDWRSKVSAAVHARLTSAPTGTDAATAPTWVEIARVDGELPYERFVDILSATDTTCGGDRDCGVPGLGLSFYFAQ